MAWEIPAGFDGWRLPGLGEAEIYPYGPVEPDNYIGSWPYTTISSKQGKVWGRSVWQPLASEYYVKCGKKLEAYNSGFPGWDEDACLPQRYSKMTFTETARWIQEDNTPARPCDGAVYKEITTSDAVWSYAYAWDGGDFGIDLTKDGTIHLQEWSLYEDTGPPPACTRTLIYDLDLTELEPTHISNDTDAFHAGNDASLAITLSEPINTAFLQSAIDLWKGETMSAKEETGETTESYRTETDEENAVVSGGYVRFPWPEDAPEGAQIEVDAVTRKMLPINVYDFSNPIPSMNGGSGSAVLSNTVTSVRDIYGHWPIGKPAHEDLMKVASAAYDGVSMSWLDMAHEARGYGGACWRLVSKGSGTKYSAEVTFTVLRENASHEFSETEVTHNFVIPTNPADFADGFAASPWCYWDDLVGDTNDLVRLSMKEVTPVVLKRWNPFTETWVEVLGSEDPWDLVYTEEKMRVGQRWGFPRWDAEDFTDLKMVETYATLTVDLDLTASGDNEGDCGDEMTGSISVSGGVTVDWAGNITNDTCSASASFGGKDFDPNDYALPGMRNLVYILPPFLDNFFYNYVLGAKGIMALNVAQACADIDDGSITATTLPLIPRGDSYTGSFEARRDWQYGFGEQTAIATLTLSKNEGIPPEDPQFSEWAELPDAGAGEEITIENLRWVT